MNFKEVYTSILKARGLSQTDVANMMDTSPSAVNQVISRQNPKLNTVVEHFEKMGYMIVAVPKGSKIKEQSFEITE